MIYRILLCCVWSLPLVAQTARVDSLKSVLQTIPADTDTARLHRRAQLMWSISTQYFRPLKDFEQCRQYGRGALGLYQHLQMPRGVAQSLSNIGFAYLYENRSPEAVDTLLQAYRVYEQLKDTAKMTYLISTVASHLFEMPEQVDQALAYARLCVDLSTRAQRLHGLCACSHLLGDLYDRTGQPDSAAYFVQNALNLAENASNIPGIVPLYLTMARLAERKHLYQEEKNWLLKAEEAFQKYPDMVTEETDINLLLALSRCMIHLGDWTTASMYLRKSEMLIPKIKDKSYHERYYLDKSQLAEHQNQPAEALRYFKLHISARDSVQNLENTRRMTEIQVKHSFEQKRIQEAAKQAQELALRDARTQQQRWMFGLILLGILTGAGFAFYTYRQKQERRRTELELANLRAQINPHFIFNCLNSIYRYTKERDTDTAAKYLQKFSQLLRLVLENSRSEKITLARDLEALQLYVDIESLRFKDKLQFQLDIDPDIDPSFLHIPGMLIQPHVENAIWHGLMHRKEGGNIRVHLHQPAEHLLQVVIEDNGVGRAAAMALESKSAMPHKGLGQKITAERLKATGRLSDMETTDLYDADGNPEGTRVTMLIHLG
jgi:tetratricopeptide (TPR) repeat protein